MSRVGQFLNKLFSGVAASSGAQIVPLRAYGKWPLYAEYRRLELAPGVSTVFSQWLDAGRLAWMHAAPRFEQPAKMAHCRLLLRLPGAKELVIASVWDSRDNVGREFPFSFFITCPPEALGADALEVFTSTVFVWDLFDGYYAELRRLTSGDFYKAYQKRAIAPKRDDLAERVRALLELASRIDAEAWFAGLGVKDQNAADWFGSLVRRSQRWQQAPNAAAQLAVSCPLAAGVASDPQACIWLRWFEPFARAAGRAAWLIAPGREHAGPGLLHLGLRDLLPEDFQLMTAQAGEYGYVENLLRTPKSVEGGADGAAAGDPAPRGSLLSWFASRSIPSDSKIALLPRAQPIAAHPPPNEPAS